MSPLALRRYRAERLLRRDFDGLRATVLASVRRRLAARGMAAETVDLEACYAQAWHGLYTQVLAGETVRSPAAWLVVVAFRRAVEDARALAAARRPVPEAGAREPDFAARVDDLDRLRQVFQALRGRLDGRECTAASLCYLQGLSRAEAARHMGISERRMRKLMDGAGADPGVAAKVGALLAVVGSGQWCEEQASSMRGLAFGLLDPGGERHRLAVAHQRQCPACRAYVLSLRGLAVALPPVAMPIGLGVSVGGAGVGVGGAAGGGWALVGGSLSAKLAAGCVLALGVGAGCVVLAGPGRDRTSAPRAVAIRAQSRPVRRVATSAPRGPAATIGRPAPARAPRAALAGRGAPAHHEFGPEARRLPRSPRAPLAALARVAPLPAPPSNERRARREFGAG